MEHGSLGAALTEAEGRAQPGRRGPVAGYELRRPQSLAGLFGPAVVQPIAPYVAAKLYLCFDTLSRASRASYKLQSGPLDCGEGGDLQKPALLARGGYAEAVRRHRQERNLLCPQPR